jgi:hypothetical protein
MIRYTSSVGEQAVAAVELLAILAEAVPAVDS